MAEEKKLFLLDAYALIYRAYFAFANNPRLTSKGRNTSAIFGFTTTLMDVLRKHNPTHIAVVFDVSSDEPDQRTVIFSEYKAGREAMPEDIRQSISDIRRVIEGFNIPILESVGYEADDVIGTIARKAETEGFQTYMMTPDKDMAQLVTKNIFLYKPGRMGNPDKVMGIAEVCERYQLENTLQVIDLLGMMGDSVDNIPGIPGVGEKTAIKYLKAYGSMEGLYENADEIKGKIGEKIRANKEQAFMSKVLATIMIDAPVEFNEVALRNDEPNKEVLTEIFTELEFRTLAKRFLDTDITVPKATSNGQPDLFSQGTEDVPLDDGFKTIEDADVKYQLVEKGSGIKALVKKLCGLGTFAFDTETTNVDPLRAEIVGMSFCWEKGKAAYIPFPSDQNETKERLSLLAPIFENEKTRLVAQNGKYDINVLSNYDMEVKCQLFDTMIAHYLLEPEMNRRNMDLLAQQYLGYKTISIETLIGKKGKNQGSMRDVEPSRVVNYACEDADITLQLAEIFEPRVKEEGIDKLLYDIELPLVNVLAAMEQEGINLKTERLKEFSLELGEDIQKRQTGIYELAGHSFNIKSPKQVGEVLFEELKIVEKPKKTKTGQYSTNEEVLRKLENKHEIVRAILDYREVVKLKSTYVDPLPDLVNPNSNRLHTSYNQTVAATGRLSSDKPNLQNIPIRTEKGRLIREAFVPRNENYSLLAADYSQVELRIIAALSNDEGMIEAFKQGLDIHTATAAKVYDLKIDEVTKDQRRNAKTANFGIIYGISAFGLSERLSIPRGEAKEIIDNYFAKYPGIKTYMDEQIEKARSGGYVETILGRKRYLRDINSQNATVRGHAERNAINAPIQGSAADIIKLAMINIQRKMEADKMQSKMILQVHDELVFDALKEEQKELKTMVVDQMKNAVELVVPLEVEASFGNNWLEAH